MDREMLFALVEIIILLPLTCGLAYLAIRFGFGRAKSPWGFNHGKRMRVLEQVSMGPKCGLSLVQVGGKYLLFAHQEGCVVLVKELDELPAEIDIASPQWPAINQLVNNINLFGTKQGGNRH
ncbi:flagellar biosynthetic protein FliO [Desulfallas thermosapovorans]|uniref:flagellar biosynthetic protein FliO n=1 Tax=Desulfallas thermosapovorans TaxID=58137 RepID=UPI001412E68B|nr:flagellar biosynthetic protein FliO [Desulfallas thermosapovorans]